MRPRPSALVPLLFVAATLAALGPALLALHKLSEAYDWRYFESMTEIARRTVAWYHQAPLWNPYSCGGEVDLANPQSMDAAPTFLLILLFGTAAGTKLALCIYYFCALDGTYRLGQRLGLSRPGALLSAFGYGLSGYLALHLSAGHINFAGVGLFPYLVLFYDRALDEIEWVIPMGLIAAWIAVLGGTFTPAMAGVLLLFWGAAAAVSRRSLRPLWLLGLAGAVALCAGAIRMLPTLEFIHDHPRPLFRRTPDVSTPWQVLGDLWAWRILGPIAGRRYWSHEYTARLPYVLLPLWLGSLLLLRRNAAARRLWLLTLFGGLLAMGNFSPVAPWALLQKLPVLRDLRVPSRHLVLATLGVALLAGLALDRLLAARRPLVARIAGALLIAACALDGAAFTATQFRFTFTAIVPIPPGPVPFHHVEGSWQSMREILFSGHGDLHCDEEAPLQRAEALDAGDVPQERLLDPDAGEILRSGWSPGRREVTLDLRRDTLLLINSNWNEHWHADRGRVVKVAGRLAVDLSGLAPGHPVITLRYAPRSYVVGVVLTLVSLPLLLWLFVTRRRRR